MGVAVIPHRVGRLVRSALGIPDFVEAPATAAELLLAYERDGFVAGGPLLSESELVALRAEFDRIFEAGPSLPYERRRVAEGGEHEFHVVYDLHRGSQAFLEVVRHEGLAARLFEITGHTELRVIRDQVQYKPPRVGGRNSWHRDMPSFPLAPPYTGLTAWIALDDATRRTGAMRMVPGSHRFGPASDIAVKGDGWGLSGIDGLGTYAGHRVEVVSRPVRAGHVHFHHDLTWHSSGRNGTRQKRRAFAILLAGADDVYRANRWEPIRGLTDGDRLDAAAPLVVRHRGGCSPRP